MWARPASASCPRAPQRAQGADILSAQFPSTTGTTLQIAVQTGDGSRILDAGNLAKLNTFTQWLDTQPHVKGVISLTQLPASPQGGPALSSAQLISLYTSFAFLQNPDAGEIRHLDQLGGYDTRHGAE